MSLPPQLNPRDYSPTILKKNNRITRSNIKPIGGASTFGSTSTITFNLPNLFQKGILDTSLSTFNFPVHQSWVSTAVEYYESTEFTFFPINFLTMIDNIVITIGEKTINLNRFSRSSVLRCMKYSSSYLSKQNWYQSDSDLVNGDFGPWPRYVLNDAGPGYVKIGGVGGSFTGDAIVNQTIPFSAISDLFEPELITFLGTINSEMSIAFTMNPLYKFNFCDTAGYVYNNNGDLEQGITSNNNIDVSWKIEKPTMNIQYIEFRDSNYWNAIKDKININYTSYESTSQVAKLNGAGQITKATTGTNIKGLVGMFTPNPAGQTAKKTDGTVIPYSYFECASGAVGTPNFFRPYESYLPPDHNAWVYDNSLNYNYDSTKTAFKFTLGNKESEEIDDIEILHKWVTKALGANSSEISYKRYAGLSDDYVWSYNVKSFPSLVARKEKLRQKCSLGGLYRQNFLLGFPVGNTGAALDGYSIDDQTPNAIIEYSRDNENSVFDSLQFHIFIIELKSLQF